MSFPSQQRLVRGALWSNAIFSMLTGLVVLLFAGPLSDVLGAPALILRIVGGGLLPFAALVAWVARASIDAKSIRVVSALDASWVIGTALLAIGWPDALSHLGWAAAAVIALFVASFSAAQLYGLKHALA